MTLGVFASNLIIVRCIREFIAQRNYFLMSSVIIHCRVLKVNMKTSKEVSEKAREHKVVVCPACNDIRWWCRGCGSDAKISGMMEMGVSKSVAKSIVNVQFAGCDAPLVPCFICNRNGEKPIGNDSPEDFDICCDFWLHNNVELSDVHCFCFGFVCRVFTWDERSRFSR